MNVTEEEFFYFVRVSNKELYDDKNTWRNATKHYCDLFVKNSNGKIFVSWNIWAFLFKEIWFIYRKMYARGLLLLFSFIWIQVLVIGLIYSYSSFNRSFEFYWPSSGLKNLISKPKDIYELCLWMTLPCYFLICGLYGNHLYISWVKKEINKIKNKKKVTSYINNQQKSVSWLWAVLILFLFYIFEKLSPIIVYVIYMELLGPITKILVYPFQLMVDLIKSMFNPIVLITEKFVTIYFLIFKNIMRP